MRRQRVDSALGSRVPERLAQDLQARRAEMFPTLSDVQIERMRAGARERTVQAGEILFEQGAPSTSVFVVLEGSIEVVHPKGPIEELITILERGGFTGEINVLAGTRSFVRGRVRTAGRVLEIDRAGLRGNFSRMMPT